MRMRFRTNVHERIAACGDWIIQTSDDSRNVNDVLAERDLVDYAKVFHRECPIFLEVGCGQGGFACESAILHPENCYLAVERIENIVLTGAERAHREKIANLRFLRAKAECLEKYIPENSISGIYLNFSTPLPRQGYAKQRLTSPRFLEIYSKLLEKDGFICQKTDDKDFYEYSIKMFAENGFSVTEKTEDLHKNGEVGIVTEYERKFISLGKPIYAITARKKD